MSGAVHANLRGFAKEICLQRRMVKFREQTGRSKMLNHAALNSLPPAHVSMLDDATSRMSGRLSQTLLEKSYSEFRKRIVVAVVE